MHISDVSSLATKSGSSTGDFFYKINQLRHTVYVVQREVAKQCLKTLGGADGPMESQPGTRLAPTKTPQISTSEADLLKQAAVVGYVFKVILVA